MIPDGWSRQVVGELFVVQLGKMLNKVAKQRHPQFPYLTNFNVRWGSFNTEELNTMYFSEKDREKFALKRGDLILCEGGEVGRCAIWDENIATSYYQKALHRLRPKEDILPRYFQAYMESIAGTKLLEDYTSRTSIAHLTREKLLKLPVLLPPLPEQKKIAEILSTWDKAIETVEKLVTNSQQKKKALMQQLLTGKKRFPEFDGEWKEVRLGDIANIGTGSSKTKFIDEGGERFIIDMGSVSRDGKLIPSKRTNYADNYLSKGQLVMPKDDIGGGNIIGRVGYIDQNNQYILGDHVYALTIKNEDNLFMSYLINGEIVNKSLRRKANGTAQLGLGKKDVEKQSVTIPTSIKEQQQIASVLSSADQEIETWQQELAHLQQEKKALMQQLLTGKRRVKLSKTGDSPC